MSTILHNERWGQRKWAWIWTAYAGFIFIQPIFFEPTLRLWTITLSSLFLFLILYAIYVHTSDDQNATRFWIIGAFFALGAVVSPLNQGATTYFVFTASFLPFSIASPRRVLSFLIGESLFILLEYYGLMHQTHLHVEMSLVNTLIAVALVLLIGGGNIFAAEQRRANCRLHMANEEIEAIAAVAERERIARDLHDVLGHTLSLIVLKAELAGRLMERDPQRAATEIADVERTARTALAEVREAIGGYRTRGLVAEIENARRTLDTAGVTMVSEITASDANGLTAGEESVLSLAMREAVTNIVRHAKAHSCRIRFVTQDGRRRLLVEDDGSHPLVREGNGLRGMRERIESLGGTLRVERDHGTRLLIELPTSTPAFSGVTAS